MAITVRKGYESQFDINKMLPGEFAVTTDTHKVYVCMAAGVSKELASVEELRNILDASDEAFEAFQELINAMEDGTVVTGLLNDVSNLKSGNYAISFSEAEERNNIESTDTIKVIFGKIKKFFSSLSDVAFSGNYNDISNTPDLSDVALTGKSVDVTYDNSTSGIEAEDVQGAIDEVSEKTVKNSSDISVLNTKIGNISYGTKYFTNSGGSNVVKISLSEIGINGRILHQYPAVQATINSVSSDLYVKNAYRTSDTEIAVTLNTTTTSAFMLSVMFVTQVA